MHLARIRRNGSYELNSKDSHGLEKLPHNVVDEIISSCPVEMTYEEIAAKLQDMGYKGATRWTVGYRRRKLGLRKYSYGELRKHREWVRRIAIKKYGRKCELCDYSAALDVHHLVPRYKGGQHELGNLMVVCPNCHALITRGLVAIHQRSEIGGLRDQLTKVIRDLYGLET